MHHLASPRIQRVWLPILRPHREPEVAGDAIAGSRLSVAAPVPSKPAYTSCSRDIPDPQTQSRSSECWNAEQPRACVWWCLYFTSNECKADYRCTYQQRPQHQSSFAKTCHARASTDFDERSACLRKASRREFSALSSCGC